MIPDYRPSNTVTLALSQPLLCAALRNQAVFN
jgi:hypothetical protein